MLNNQALAELSKLKQQIEDSKDSGEGIVVGSQGRHGFVKLDDGRSIYLPADTMEKVLPGDRIKVEVITNDQKKLEAKLEKLLQKNFKRFVATYSVKGKNHFVIPDHKEIKRGLFVPPKERKQFTDGQYVLCQLTRHPIADGRAQAKVLELIGDADSKGIQQKLVQAKSQLPGEFSPKALQQAEEIANKAGQVISGIEKDLCDLPFITIDAEDTRDLDDALFAKCIEAGDEQQWQLYAAIADPSAFIAANSPLDREAKTRASSVYFPGHRIPMLPPSLSNELFSLLPNQSRAALVCSMLINSDGEIIESEFFQARMQSKAKLSYESASAVLQGDDNDLSREIKDSLRALAAIANARRQYRQQHCLVQEDNIDYAFQLDEKLAITAVVEKQLTPAHRLVEEAMLATNICAGDKLARQAADKALFSCHSGFRAERVNELRHLLKREEHPCAELSLETLPEFVQFMQTCSNTEEQTGLKNIARRLLQAGEISPQAKPHFGLGLAHYALVTSPIRRYQDLHNHRLLKQLEINQAKAESMASDLQESLTTIRQAQREINQRLLCHYLADKEGQTFNAKIVAVSSQGLATRLMENGAEGFIPLRNSAKLTVKYDSICLTLTVNDTLFELEQVVPVVLEKVRLNNYQLQLRIDTTL